MKHLKIPVNNGRYYKGIWLEIFDGGSGQWLWVVRDGLSYIFLEVIDLVEYMGRDATEVWSASVSVVDLITTPLETVASAIRSAGAEDMELDFKKESDRLAIAEMCYSHGAKAPLWDGFARDIKDIEKERFADRSDHDPEFLKLRKEAREFAETLFDEAERNEQLDNKVVNALGQTAREYANGTVALWDSLRRIQALGDDATDAQKLMLKMYAGAERTLGGNMIPEDLKQ